ncbi:MAG: hypothetical protein AMXMBFR7_02420 [Planctomycetota bacterium]
MTRSRVIILGLAVIAICSLVVVGFFWRDWRIGRNEEKVIEACKQYVEAQDAYRRTDYDLDGVLEYATSTMGPNGLYELKAGSGDLKLLNESISRAFLSSPDPEPYFGYFFSILTGQGIHAPGGSKSYLVSENLTLGYGLLAFPAEYGISGRNTYLVNNTGTIYAKNLGSIQKDTALAMTYMGNTGTQEHGVVYPTKSLSNLAEIEVSPTLDTPLQDSRSTIWCGTSDLAWHELKEFLGGPVLIQNPPAWLSALNESPFDKAMISESSCIAVAGKMPTVLEKIREQGKSRFGAQFLPPGMPEVGESSDLIAYSYLEKVLEFAKPFHKKKAPLHFQGKPVASFGLWDGEDGWHDLSDQIAIWEYQNPSRFIVELLTKSREERLVLARLPLQETLRLASESVIRAIDKEKALAFHEGDKLEIPILKFEIERVFQEISGRPIQNPGLEGLILSGGMQSIRFELNERGAEVISWATWVVSNGDLPQKPRSLIFDGPFLILLAKRNAPLPYFALWVSNPSILTEFKDF